MRIRRRGRHTAPSQVEKVTEKAGKAAPAMAIAGALVAAPQAQHALARPATVATAQAHKPAAAAHQRPATATLESLASHGSISSIAASTRHSAAKSAARNIYYKVQAGDTLSKIADRYYHNADDWPWLYHANNKTVQDPDLIYSGETLVVQPLPANFSPDSYIPRHAKPATTASSDSAASTAGTTAVTQSSGESQGSSGAPDSGSGAGSGSRSGSPMGSGGGGQGSRSGSPMGSGGGGAGVLGGQLGCQGLEDLWDAAGGNPAHAFMAAEIAMAESGGNQYALSPTDDYGYWQINISNGALATFNAYGNARSAIILSDDGTNWSPWTTYTSGAYVGRC